MELAFWRDLSVVWLSLFCFVGLLPPLAILYFAVRGMNALHEMTHGFLHKAQSISHRIPAQTEEAAKRVQEPIVKWRRQTTRVETFLQSLLGHG